MFRLSYLFLSGFDFSALRLSKNCYRFVNGNRCANPDGTKGFFAEPKIFNSIAAGYIICFPVINADWAGFLCDGRDQMKANPYATQRPGRFEETNVLLLHVFLCEGCCIRAKARRTQQARCRAEDRLTARRSQNNIYIQHVI